MNFITTRGYWYIIYIHTWLNCAWIISVRKYLKPALRDYLCTLICMLYAHTRACLHTHILVLVILKLLFKTSKNVLTNYFSIHNSLPPTHITPHVQYNPKIENPLSQPPVYR